MTDLKRYVPLLVFALLALLAAPAALALTPVCYTTTIEACAPPPLAVRPADVIALPGLVRVSTQEDRITLRIRLPGDGGVTWASEGTPIGDADLAFADDRNLLYVGPGDFGVQGLAVTGDILPGDVITARLEVVNPNTSTLVGALDVVLANVSGVTDLRVLTFNPAVNLIQQTILRLVNLDPDIASVVIRGHDDAGNASGDVWVDVPAAGAVQLNSADLEAGNEAKAAIGALGAPVGKWTLRLVSGWRVRAHVLVRNNSDGTLSDLGGVEPWE